MTRRWADPVGQFGGDVPGRGGRDRKLRTENHNREKIISDAEAFPSFSTLTMPLVHADE